MQRRSGGNRFAPATKPTKTTRNTSTTTTTTTTTHSVAALTAEMAELNLQELDNAQLVEHMRKCHNEKFKTLVRMHLSFELDLHTDQRFNLPCHEIVYEDKGKLRKWNRLSKKHSHLPCKSQTGGSAGNSPSVGLLQQPIDAGFLLHWPELKQFLMQEKHICTDGIFRISGSLPRRNELRLLLKKENPLNLQDADFTVHDCACIIKQCLQEMPEPLLTDALYPAYEQISPLCLAVPDQQQEHSSSKPISAERQQREQHLLHTLQLLLLLLPEQNLQLLREIMHLLHAVACNAQHNHMTPQNLAIMFAPSLICPRDMPPEALNYVSRKLTCIIAYMIRKFPHIFEISDKLAMDLRAYLLERKYKQTQSPEQPLDESMSDISIVNTVFTFVNRELTAEAHNKNTTETELAQLYAHIQSMPESKKKRNLIKQFNTQNGRGTPLQLVRMDRLKNNNGGRSVKSFTETIKKHIYQRTHVTRTPKTATAASAMGAETPKFCTNKNAKLRVLFQSPAQTTTATTIANTNTTTATIALKNLQHSPISHTATATTTATTTATATPLLVKTRSMRKSLSSNSLCLCHQQQSDKPSCLSAIESPSKSAPVSRQSSKDIATAATATTAAKHCCSSKFISDAAKNIKNFVCKTATTEERYKSAPNLSSKEHMIDVPSTVLEGTVHATGQGPHSFKNKLIKGVSMSNLKFFGAAETHKRDKRIASDEHMQDNNLLTACNLAFLDDETFVDAPDDQLSGSSSSSRSNSDHDEFVGLSTANANVLVPNYATTPSYSNNNICQQLLLQQSGLYRNLDLLSSTPALQRCRRSMSPITKSAQRMPKAMQESIMTPRSRKPVMVLTTTHGSSDQNQTINQTDMSGLREENEEDSLSLHAKSQTISSMNSEDTNSLSEYMDIMKRQQLLKVNSSFVPAVKASEYAYNAANKENLTTDFKKYLLERNLVASPADSSFASQPDDFIDDLNESQLNASLLYCLDGNEPETTMPESIDKKPNNARKRAAAAACDEDEQDNVVATTAAIANIKTKTPKSKKDNKANKIFQLPLTGGPDETDV